MRQRCQFDISQGRRGTSTNVPVPGPLPWMFGYFKDKMRFWDASHARQNRYFQDKQHPIRINPNPFFFQHNTTRPAGSETTYWRRIRWRENITQAHLATIMDTRWRKQLFTRARKSTYDVVHKRRPLLPHRMMTGTAKQLPCTWRSSRPYPLLLTSHNVDAG